MIYFDQFIAGVVKAQPRPRAFCRGKRAGMYNPDTADAWKMCIKNAVSGLQLGDLPLGVIIHVTFKRPKSHYGSRQGVPYLKPAAPVWHTNKPDVDNVAKAILDAISDAGAWGDDKQVTYLKVTKEWGNVDGASLMIFDAAK